MAGDQVVVRHFPFRIGRAAENDLCLDDPGIWAQHLILQFQKNEGYFLQTVDEAFVTINEQPQTSARLRNGDLVAFGSAKMQFWLAAAEQKKLQLREAFVWLLLAAVTGLQLFLLLRWLK